MGAIRHEIRGDDPSKAAAVAIAFGKISSVSAYDMCRALAAIDTEVGLPKRIKEYVRDAMCQYRQHAREDLASIDTSGPICVYYAKFCTATTWTQVVEAFEAISISTPADKQEDGNVVSLPILISRRGDQ